MSVAGLERMTTGSVAKRLTLSVHFAPLHRGESWNAALVTPGSPLPYISPPATVEGCKGKTRDVMFCDF